MGAWVDQQYLNIDMNVLTPSGVQTHPLHCSNLPINILREAVDEYKDIAVGASKPPWWLDKFEAFVDNYIPTDPEMSKTKNYTLLLDEVYKQDYHTYLDSRIVNYLDNLKGDI